MINLRNKSVLRSVIGSLVALAIGVLGLPGFAQEFPSKPFKFIVPFPPGSATDTSARHYGKKLAEITGQGVIIENKPGANGFIAVKALLAAPADGYTVFIGSNSTLAVNAALFKALPYDPVADFSPLSMLVRVPALLIVPASSPHQTLAELMAAAKSQPDSLTYGAGSAGYQLMAELFNETARIQTRGVPFKGASEAVMGVASASVNLSFVEITSAQELIKSGKLRGLAIASMKRSPVLPTVPTASEAGLSGYTAYAWVAAAVASKTPRDETEKLASLFTRIANLAETREFYDRIGGELMRGGPEEMRAFQNAEITLWKRIAAQAKIEQQ